ncbi:MAG: putative damage-inducible protein DinB [Saprospiraceae bacterium]|jgi:uncharacterized damage-inducible protein DinB
MIAQNKAQLIEQLQKEVRRQSEIVTGHFKELSDEKLLATAENGGWSVIQNLEHLNLYYDYYNTAIKKSLEQAQKDNAASVFKSGWLGNYFTNSMDYRTKGKIKAFKDYIPKVDLNPVVVIRKFLANQEEIFRLLEDAKDYDLSKIKTAISLTRWIKMRMGDVFQFVIMHNERHIVQAQSRL